MLWKIIPTGEMVAGEDGYDVVRHLCDIIPTGEMVAGEDAWRLTAY